MDHLFLFPSARIDVRPAGRRLDALRLPHLAVFFATAIALLILYFTGVSSQEAGGLPNAPTFSLAIELI
jgi:hypothetical protein